MRDAIGYIPGMIILLVLGFGGYTMFVWTPVSLYYEAKCLEKGYPESRVSVGLVGYCMNLDGTVTVKVDSL